MEIFLTQSEELIARGQIPRRDLSITLDAHLGATGLYFAALSDGA